MSRGILSDACRHRPHSSHGVVGMLRFCYSRFLIPLHIDFLRFFFSPSALVLCSVAAFDFCPELTVQEMCAGKNFCSIHSFFQFPLSSTAAGVIAGLVTECSTFIYAAMLSFSPNCVPTLILCGLLLFAVLEECDCFDCSGSLVFFFFFYTSQCVLRL